MKSREQDMKVETDYKISRHHNGIVSPVVGLVILILLVLLFFLLRARKKAVPPKKPALSARLHLPSANSALTERRFPYPDYCVVEGNRHEALTI